MYKLGLIGRSLQHSFSKKYFDQKFFEEKNNIFSYHLYDLEELNEIKYIYDQNLIGINITSPYKKKIINHIDELDESAEKTKSVNTVFINPKNKKKIGYNTDIIGFEGLLVNNNLSNNTTALVLGSGGAAQSVKYVLNKKNIKFQIVSRKPDKKNLNYNDLKYNIKYFKLIINTTPLGQYPLINNYPNIPYNLISNKHKCIDLIYNPKKTMFLKKAEEKGAKIFNGYEMLTIQAEESFLIWKNCLKNIGCLN